MTRAELLPKMQMAYALIRRGVQLGRVSDTMVQEYLGMHYATPTVSAATEKARARKKRKTEETE